jgi:hypothetical protein
LAKSTCKQHLQLALPSSALAATLTDEDWSTLVSRDLELHELGNSLAGIRQWWTNNRNDFVCFRKKVRGLENDIELLLRQMNERQTTDFTKRALQAQIELREEDIKNQLEWLKQNPERMDLVHRQFQEIRRTPCGCHGPSFLLGCSGPRGFQIGTTHLMPIHSQRSRKLLKSQRGEPIVSQ